MAATEFRILRKLSEINPAQWNALHDGSNPFVAHAFLSGLEQHGCLRTQWGWTPYHPSLWQGEKLLAAAPGYLKSNSHGEFVFDHAWADAFQRHGLAYYPKWLLAIPYSPVTGPRLLADDAKNRDAMLAEICAHAQSIGLSSVHANFLTETDNASLNYPWLARTDVQFHWHNQDWLDFDAFLHSLQRKKRKNILQERAKVKAAGVRFRWVGGHEVSEQELQAMHDLYVQTFDAYGNSPALTLPFFRHLATRLPDSLVMILAERDNRIIAGALCLRGGDTLYGRYWGSSESLPGLHFETCYYQGIEYCLKHRLRCFEPGAQGQHKIARGFLPTATHSRHWISHPEFSQAIGRWCAHERQATAAYEAELLQHSPFA